MTNVASMPVQTQPQQQTQSKFGMILSSVADTALTAAAGAGAGAAVGTVASFVKPVNQEALRQNIYDVFVANNKGAEVVKNHSKAVANGIKLAKEGATEEAFNCAAKFLDATKAALDEAVSKITKNDAIYKEAKKLTKKFSRPGVIGAFAGIGAVAFMLGSTLKGVLPKPKAKEDTQIANMVANQKPFTEPLGTVQG